jgi:hypothetical protein
MAGRGEGSIGEMIRLEGLKEQISHKLSDQDLERKIRVPSEFANDSVEEDIVYVFKGKPSGSRRNIRKEALKLTRSPLQHLLVLFRLAAH